MVNATTQILVLNMGNKTSGFEPHFKFDGKEIPDTPLIGHLASSRLKL